jgi:hypothetical protein
MFDLSDGLTVFWLCFLCLVIGVLIGMTFAIMTGARS